MISEAINWNSWKAKGSRNTPKKRIRKRMKEAYQKERLQKSSKERKRKYRREERETTKHLQLYRSPESTAFKVVRVE